MAMINRTSKILKPWGHEVIFANNRKYIGKIITIFKGHRLSLQYHRMKMESLYVLSGHMVLTLGGIGMVIGPGESFHIKPRQRHRFSAQFGEVVLIEVSTPHPKDVVRV